MTLRLGLGVIALARTRACHKVTKDDLKERMAGADEKEREKGLVRHDWDLVTPRATYGTGAQVSRELCG